MSYMQCKDQNEQHDLMMMMIQMQTYENHHHGYGGGSIQSILQQLRSLRDRINQYIDGINNYRALITMAEPPTNLQRNDERSIESALNSRDDYRHYHHQSSYSEDHGHMVIIPKWRPQRGLPARSVSVLRAWLFDHFLHP